MCLKNEGDQPESICIKTSKSVKAQVKKVKDVQLVVCYQIYVPTDSNGYCVIKIQIKK